MADSDDSDLPAPDQKWVDYNYRAKQKARKLNGGKLPYSDALHSTDFPNKDVWDEDNVPLILFYLIPPESPFDNNSRKILKDANGDPVKRNHRNVLEFDILPSRIAVDVKGWLVEAWRRIDPRIGYRDILDRMVEDPGYGGGIGLRKPSKNILQNHCRRACRRLLNMWLEYGRRDVPHRTEVETIENLTYENILYNTVLPRCKEFPDRLVKMRFHKKNKESAFRASPFQVTAENVLETTLPLDYFLRDVPHVAANPDRMTPEMMDAWWMLLRLQERAVAHHVLHWSKLDRQCLPSSWFDRTRQKTYPNNTYDGGCPGCTWTSKRPRTWGWGRDSQSETDEVTLLAPDEDSSTDVIEEGQSDELTNEAMEDNVGLVLTKKRSRDHTSGDGHRLKKRRAKDVTSSESTDEIAASPDSEHNPPHPTENVCNYCGCACASKKKVKTTINVQQEEAHVSSAGNPASVQSMLGPSIDAAVA